MVEDVGLKDIQIKIRQVIHPMLANHNVVMNICSEIVLEIVRAKNKNTYIVFLEWLSYLNLERGIQVTTDENGKHVGRLTEVWIENWRLACNIELSWHLCIIKGHVSAVC